MSDPALFGHGQGDRLVAVEVCDRKSAACEALLFTRDGAGVSSVREVFRPFLLVADGIISGCPVKYEVADLHGTGVLRNRVSFITWKDLQKAKAWLAKSTRVHAGDPKAPYLCINDAVQQFLVATGRTLFRGMRFEDLRRMQVDIECVTTPGYEFCNAEREGDRIVMIGVGDGHGGVDVISGADLDEAAMIQRFVEMVCERDPDVIEGHNFFNFDLPYLRRRAERHGIALALGRDGSVPVTRPSRFSAGERTIAYDRSDIFGRHVVDTLFLVHLYDVSHRSLPGYGLKEVAVHFGIAAPQRTHVRGKDVTDVFRTDPGRLVRYVSDDVRETEALARLLSLSSFVQAQMLPYSYQNVCVRGNATKIDALMIREYLRQEQAIPLADAVREFEGGFTDVFEQGVLRNVHHCDVRSLYPSLMLARKIRPASDERGVFLALLAVLRDFRLKAKALARKAGGTPEGAYYDALQTAFKVLINSFYGYLGFSQAHFGDFAAAERVTAEGRALLKQLIDWLRAHEARVIEVDTDGIYFVPPESAGTPAGRDGFREAFIRALPEGIEIDFDGEYVSMYSYKMKNYALLTAEGEVIIKGAALKSRGLEPFQREFMEEAIRLKLEGRDAKLPALKKQYEESIRTRTIPIAKLAKTETLLDAPSTYQGKQGRGERARSAAYELALKSGRDFRAGDQISYYVTGEKKSVAVHEAARLLSEWDAARRNENVAYYLAKLDALYDKFTGSDAQSEMTFGS